MAVDRLLTRCERRESTDQQIHHVHHILLRLHTLLEALESLFVIHVDRLMQKIAQSEVADGAG